MSITVQLDRECWPCSGTGKKFDQKTHEIVGVCHGCRGTGLCLTDTGHALAEFLERHFGLKRRETE